MLDLLKDQTFEEIKVSDICSKALVNRSTFYAHFNDKYELVASFINDLKESLTSELKNIDKNISLKEYGCADKTIPKDWVEAFLRLKTILQDERVKRDPYSGRRVVFLDELPWMDTAKSDFKSALDYFWNSWASSQKDLMLIVCGSATSWIINNLLSDRGGFYNRITRRITPLDFMNLPTARKPAERPSIVPPNCLKTLSKTGMISVTKTIIMTSIIATIISG